MGPLDFAAYVREAAPSWLEFCEVSPSAQSLRATALGRLYTLAPAAGAPPSGWQWTPCGVLNEGSPTDLKGLSATEAKGGRVTVWYEEMLPNRYTGVEEPVDVPYTGVVLGIHYRDGLSVRFDHTLGADGKPEKIHISNEDDWAWGSRRTKAAVWSLDLPPAAGGREQHTISLLI